VEGLSSLPVGPTISMNNGEGEEKETKQIDFDLIQHGQPSVFLSQQQALSARVPNNSAVTYEDFDSRIQNRMPGGRWRPLEEERLGEVSMDTGHETT